MVMVLGIVFGMIFIGLLDVLYGMVVGLINILIVIGLILMMYLLFVKVCYEELYQVFVDKCVLVLLLV